MMNLASACAMIVELGTKGPRPPPTPRPGPDDSAYREWLEYATARELSIFSDRTAPAHRDWLANTMSRTHSLGVVLGADSWKLRSLRRPARRIWLCLCALGKELERPGGYRISDLRAMGRFTSKGEPSRDATQGAVDALVQIGVLKPVRRRPSRAAYSYRVRWLATLANEPGARKEWARRLLVAPMRPSHGHQGGRPVDNPMEILPGCFYLGWSKLPAATVNRLRVGLMRLSRALTDMGDLERATTPERVFGESTESEWPGSVIVIDPESLVLAPMYAEPSKMASEAWISRMWKETAARRRPKYSHPRGV